jgi:HEAT repeat protein
MRPLTVLILFSLGCGSSQPPHVGKSLDQLIEMVKRDDPGQQIQGAIGLARLGETARLAVPDLTRLLSSSDTSIRENAVNALGQIASPDSIPELEKMLRDPQWTVRRHAVLALGKIADPRSIKSVEGLLKDPDSLVRKAAQETLARLKGK